jgi:hypothetical protein
MYSGLDFHMYLLDYDGDGYLDIVYPDKLRNQIVFVRNPGSVYWIKMISLKDKYSMSSKDRL